MNATNGVRRMAAIAGGVLASVLVASTALAHECTNASKSDPSAGAQVLIGPDGQIEWATPGVANRVAQGLIDPATGEGFRGIVAFDLDGDGEAEWSTWIGVGPDGEIPLNAQFNGPADKGVTNVCLAYPALCAGG